MQIGFIGRLDYQKGPDIIQAALPELMNDDVQMVNSKFKLEKRSRMPCKMDQNQHIRDRNNMLLSHCRTRMQK
mgnify:FL=1